MNTAAIEPVRAEDTERPSAHSHGEYSYHNGPPQGPAEGVQEPEVRLWRVAYADYYSETGSEERLGEFDHFPSR